MQVQVKGVETYVGAMHLPRGLFPLFPSAMFFLQISPKFSGFKFFVQTIRLRCAVMFVFFRANKGLEYNMLRVMKYYEQ